MSLEYPCVYYDNEKCRKFTDDKFTSRCILGPCGEQKLSNADRIRAMSDEELVRWVGMDSCPKGAVCTLPVNCEKCWLDWLRQPFKDGDNE